MHRNANANEQKDIWASGACASAHEVTELIDIRTNQLTLQSLSLCMSLGLSLSGNTKNAEVDKHYR